MATQPLSSASFESTWTVGSCDEALFEVKAAIEDNKDYQLGFLWYLEAALGAKVDLVTFT